MKLRAAPSALGLFALALLPLVPGVARAQTTPDGAAALEQQIHDWMSSTLGPDVKITQRPIQVTANGDHYDLAVPLGDEPGAPRWTATARERSGGRWAIDDVRVTSPAEFHVKLPVPSTPGGSPEMTDITYKLSIAQQAGQLLVDPSFATTTTSTSSVKGLVVQSSGGMAPMSSQIDSGSGSLIIQPAMGGRIDVALDSNLDGYTIDTTVSNAGPLKLGFGKTHVAANASSISRDRAVQVLQAAIKIGKAMTPTPGDTGADATPPAESAEVILEALADLATGASLDETLQNITVDVGGMAGSLHAMQIGFAAKGAGGLLQAQVDLGAEGLVLPELGLGAMVQLIPTKFSIRPTVSGVPVEAAMALAKASSQGDDPTPDDIMALFARGPISAGVETLTLDVGGAEFTGLGKLQIASPQSISGTAQITATNLDLLQQKLAAEPSLAQAAPVLIFLKGIGRTVGNQMVWDITYNGGRVLVNNQDLSALTGGAAAPTPAPAPPVQTVPPVQRPQNGQPQLRRRP